MKTVFGLLALALSTGAFANNSLCARLELSFNTHPHRSCPALKAVCLTAQDEGDLQVQMADDTELTLPFGGLYTEDWSDVGARLYQSYDMNGHSVEVTLNSDNEYPYPTRLPGIEGLSIWTGFQERSGVYTSQSCSYKSL